VIDAASTKPYVFMAFFLSLGIGGYCIPFDPCCISYRLKKNDFIPHFIETSGEIKEFMKMHVINLVKEGLRRIGNEWI